MHSSIGLLPRTKLFPFLVVSFLLSSGVKCAPQPRTLCEQYQNATTSSGRYTFLTDQWGLDSSGGQCMTIPLDEHSSSNSTSFSATWVWTADGPNATTVHAYPNVNLNSPVLPIQLSDLQTLVLNASWVLTPADSDGTKTSVSDLADIDVAANVALDLWLDREPTSAQSATNASHEIMIWQAAYGGVQPIGAEVATKYAPKTKVDGTTYKLFHGYNGVNQSVYSWLPATNFSNIHTDLSPLVHYLWQREYITEDMYLGLAQWGTEAVHSARNVTFSAKSVMIDVKRGVPKEGKGGVSRPNLALLAALVFTVFFYH